jgi:glycosyltransferase involved in cell wall biosynthesis
VLPSRGELAGDLEADGVEVLVRPLSVLRRSLASPTGLGSVIGAAARDAASLSALIRRRGVALVHSNTSIVLGGAAAAARARVPHIWQVREIYSRFGRAWPAYRRVLLSAQALPCVSQASAAQFGGSERVRIVYDGLAVERVRAPRAQARERLGLDAAAPTITVLGRISDWKGQDVLVRALADPMLASRGVIGLLAGEVWPGADDRLARVLSLADSLGVRDRLRLLGFREDVETVYGASDVVAVPSTQPDPLPGAAIEAAAAGCAIVASAAGGLPEIIRDRETGRLIAPGDSAALARVSAELLDDSWERERLGAAAAADVHTRFAPARLRAAIGELYGEVLGA